MKQILNDLKDFRNWWGKNGTGVPVWFFILTMLIILMFAYNIID
jgi:predicted negative regulator of RcsB-dependent stress response